MKQIKLTQGRVAWVDDCDFDYLNQWKWRWVKHRDSTGYAVRNRPRPSRKVIHLHHEVATRAGLPLDKLIDHKDRDGLNNSRSNLRSATPSQNSCNRALRKDSRTGRKGVSFDKGRGKWFAKIQFNGRQHFLGRFATLEAASDAYDAAALKLHGEFACLNFSIAA